MNKTLLLLLTIAAIGCKENPSRVKVIYYENKSAEHVKTALWTFKAAKHLKEQGFDTEGLIKLGRMYIDSSIICIDSATFYQNKINTK